MTFQYLILTNIQVKKFKMFYRSNKILMSTLFKVSLHIFKSIISWIQLDNHCLIILTVILWVMQSYHTSPLRCIILPAGIVYLSLYTRNLTNQTNLECILFLQTPLSLDWSAQMRWDKDHSVDY